MSPLLDVSNGRIQIVSTHYSVTELLGYGRFSEVYKAFDSSSQTHVALKIYTGFDEKSHEIAKAEQSTLLELSKLNVDWFPKSRGAKKCRLNNQNHPFIVLELGEFVESDGAKRVIRLKDVLPLCEGERKADPEPNNEFWSIENLQGWILAIVTAVHSMHSIKIIHRDLKPENILLKQGAAMSRAVPFFLDFNSSARSGNLEIQSGTPRYLPPEVVSGKRKEPSEDDDLWAVAVICWELIFGIGCALSGNPNLNPWLSETPPASLLNILRRALEINVQDRYRSAADLLTAIEESNHKALNTAKSINAEEFAYCLHAMEKIRASFNEELAGEGDLPISKEVFDQVSTLFSWLAEENSQSLDLASELIGIGPKALPAALQQGYKLSPYSPSFIEVLNALKKLGQQDQELAIKAIEFYSLSSNRSVRSMCRILCETLQIFPSILLDQLMADEGILLPSERVDIADLCIRYSKKEDSLLALTKYMCREYIYNPYTNNYKRLRDRVASPFSKLSFKDKALLIVQDTRDHIWEEIDEFEKIDSLKRPELEHGLLQLMADAFAGMGSEGLNLFKEGQVPRLSTGENPLPIFRVFLNKLAANHIETRQWLEQQNAQHPEDIDFANALNQLNNQGPTENNDEVERQLFDSYMTESNPNYSKKHFNKLRFSKNPIIFSLINSRIQYDPSDEDKIKIIDLLKGYESRQRDQVARCILDHWDVLNLTDRERCIDTLTSHGISNTALRNEALQLLGSELYKEEGSEMIRQGIDRLL